ncbi:BZ3500_MvSof-1268-A1-R1_Chr7-1g09282 [Microbotryum saponariae]|uniref:BZ3500_MvSof-1268-A1-R1_Chr7-1g09282 protein n=1 Tax=Microbotryum saponariae TaxID=289078 RepID=A0A2X0N2I5_9BASI|nr:BZ3501_MvSof-1269-A2-R1_Chr7-1g08987 [Microbotryum saponariae]SDA03151.1 BZ3500_MvSof-1268-A1-R1_Chr7-1g09282 [Microbotryum saponariae]
MARGKRNKRNPKAHAPPPISEREARLQSRRTRLQVLDHLPMSGAAPSPPAFPATSPSNLDDGYEDLEPPGSSQQGLSDDSVDATHSRSAVRLRRSFNEVDLSPGSDKRLHEPQTRPRVVDYSLSGSSMTLLQEEAPVFPEPRTSGETINCGSVASSPGGWPGSTSVEVRDDTFDHGRARTESIMSEAEPEQTARVRDSPSPHRLSVASSICSSEGSSTHDSGGVLDHDDSALNMGGKRVFNAQLQYRLVQSSNLPSDIHTGQIDLDFDDVTSSVTERLSPRPFKTILLVHRCEVPTIWPSPSQFEPTTCGVTAYEYNGDLFLSLRDVFTGSHNMCLWKGTSPPDDACGRYSRGTFSLSGSQNMIFQTDVFSQLESASPADTTLLSSAQFIRLAKGAAASDPPQLWIQMFSTEAQRREVLGHFLPTTVDLPPIGHSQGPVVLGASATDPKRGTLLTTTCPPQTDVLEPGSCPNSTSLAGANVPAPHAAKTPNPPDDPATLPFCMRLDTSGAPLLVVFLSELKPEEIRSAYVPNGTWTIPIRVERHGLNTSPIIQPIFSYSKQSGSRYRKRPHHNKYPHLSTKVKAIKSKCLGVYVCADSDCFGIDRAKGTSSVGSRSNTVSAARDGPKRHVHSTCTAHSLRRDCDICHGPLMHKTCEAYTLIAQLDDSDLTAAELADPKSKFRNVWHVGYHGHRPPPANASDPAAARAYAATLHYRTSIHPAVPRAYLIRGNTPH